MRFLNKSGINIAKIVGGGYGNFWRDHNRYRVLKGGKGSKKSTTTSLWYIYNLMKYPESNLLVVRAVMDTHRDSTFAQLKWAQEQLGVTHLWRNTVNPMSMTYKPTGQKIIFRGFDDVLKLASTTVSKGYLCWVWIEEAYEIASEDDFDKLDLSVPRSAVPPPLFNQTTLTFNPWSETHWLKRRFFDNKTPLVSTFSTDYRCNEFISPDYIRQMEEMRVNYPRKYAVAGLGEWGISEGLIYENWEELDFEPDELGIERDEKGAVIEDVSWQYRSFYGLDYGYKNDPTAFIAFKANPITKQLFIYDEFYELKMLNSDIALKITQKGYAKERIRADAAEPKSNDDLRRLGISRILPSRKGKDSIINGIAAVSEYKIFIHPTCVNTLSEIKNYCFKKDKNEKGINVPEDKNNHLMDALRYAFYDVRFFVPLDTKVKTRRDTDKRYDITSDDMEGGWE